MQSVSRVCLSTAQERPHDVIPVVLGLSTRVGLAVNDSSNLLALGV
jgi:hypothetical protein